MLATASNTEFFSFSPFVFVVLFLLLLLIEGAPQLLYKFIEQTMQPGPSVSLKCMSSIYLLIRPFITVSLNKLPSIIFLCVVFIVGSASGNPTPQIFWKLDGFPLPEVCAKLTHWTFCHVNNFYSVAFVGGSFINRTICDYIRWRS